MESDFTESAKRAQAEVERRMHAAADEILRNEWGAYAAAAVPARASEYTQILEDVSSTARLNKPDLLADYLDVIATSQYGVATSPESNLAVAHKLIALRRATELEVLPASWTPPIAREPEAPRGPIAKAWRIVSGAVVIFFAFCLVLGGAATLFADSSGLATGKRLGLGFALIAVAALLVPLFFYGEKWQRAANRRNWERAMRKAVEKGFETKP